MQQLLKLVANAAFTRLMVSAALSVMTLNALAQQIVPSVVPGSMELDALVAAVVADLNPARRSIVRGTARDSLFVLAPEWGEDIQAIGGFSAEHTAPLAALCGDCTSQHAVMLVMDRAWDVVQQQD